MVKYSSTGYWHTEQGIFTLGETLKMLLKRRYKALAMSMFRWEDDSGRSDVMFKMSLGRAPEKWLLSNSKVVIFDFHGETHMLPISRYNSVNMYGELNYWHPQPVAWSDDPIYKTVQDLELDHSNSAIIMNSLYETNDSLMIDRMVDLIVDGELTVNQRMMMCRAPFVFTVDGSPDSDVSNYMNAILNFKPWITQNIRGSMIQATVSDVNVAFDPSILDALGHWDSMMLKYIGVDSTDVHKRAQQSVPETNMSQDVVRGRRMEKLRCREKACEYFNELYGGNLQVISVFDEVVENGGMDREPDMPGEELQSGSEF